MKVKICKICKIEKTAPEFYINKSLKDGLHCYCKECTKQQARKNHAVRVADATVRKMYSDRYFKQRYGLSREQYDKRVQDQKVCAICEEALVLGINTHLDHDHKTGKLRGMLCGNCNRGLGSFRDSVKFLVAASKYLQEYTYV